MPWAAPFAKEHKDWLMKEIEALCSNPDRADIGHVKGQCDLEVVIWVHDDDRSAFSHAVMARLEAELKERTGVLKPVIYLEGSRPHHLDNPSYLDL